MASFSRKIVFLATILTVAACGQESDDEASELEPTITLSAATLGEQTVLSVREYLATEQFAGANRKQGSRLAQFCQACHSFDEGGPDMIGPALFGVFGRQVGERAGFDYSPVMQNADFRWTPRALNAWLAQPGRFLPGNRMTFAGVAKQQERDDLIAFLLETTTDKQHE